MAAIRRIDLELGEELGSGGFGAVFRGLLKTENKHVAVKILHRVDFREIDILKQLHHPNIVTLYGFVHEDTDLMIVMELCEIGSLRSFLEQRVDNPLPPSLTHDWMLQAALPIDYLRHHKVQHMDIKTDNYVITSNMVLKLTDFGLSQNLENTRSFSSEAGSWRWMSPEHLRDQKLSPKFDIYALALVFWCLFMRILPYAEYPSEFMVAEAVCTHKVRPPLPPNCSKPIWELIKACWHDDRSKRPDIRDVIVSLVHHKAAFSNSVQHVCTQTKPEAKARTNNSSTQTVSNSFTGGSFKPIETERTLPSVPTPTNPNAPYTREQLPDANQSMEPLPLSTREPRPWPLHAEVPTMEDVQADPNDSLYSLKRIVH